MDKAILIEMAPRVICRDHANAEGLRAIETLEQLAVAEGIMEWSLQYVRSKAVINMAEGDCEKAVAQLEKIRGFKSPKEAGRFGNTITLRKNEKDAFLRKATPEQLRIRATFCRPILSLPSFLPHHLMAWRSLRATSQFPLPPHRSAAILRQVGNQPGARPHEAGT